METRRLPPLMRADDIRVHARQMVVDVVLLGVRIALRHVSLNHLQVVRTHTGASMHCRSFCSSIAHP